jgi:hypothetical protein
VIGRIEAEPDDVAHPVHEARVGGQLEVLLAMRLELDRLRDPVNRRL